MHSTISSVLRDYIYALDIVLAIMKRLDAQKQNSEDEFVEIESPEEQYITVEMRVD
jgi:hypothetical protein